MTAALPDPPAPAPVHRLPSPPQDSRGLPSVHPAVAAWLDHVAAGRIGAAPPSDPAIVAARQAMERVVRGRR